MLKTRKGWIILSGVLIAAAIAGYFFMQQDQQHLFAGEDAAQEAGVDQYLEQRREDLAESSEEDPFGDDDKISILLIGLDGRVGDPGSHCDAIQFLQVNRATKRISLTAVPRGTYAPLPYGTGTVPGDYYVSNSCALGGLEYGVGQIERILGQKADYIATIGFSGVLGVLRQLELPTTETLQWLRHRQGYAIGEPQRARNHSTFLKQILTQFIPEEHSRLDVPWQYIIYNIIKTDLSFADAREISKAITEMDLESNPGRISLAMRPSFEVRDIAYNQDEVGEYLQKMISPISHLLNQQDFGDAPIEDIQTELFQMIEDQKDDEEFIEWAYDNKLWYQIEDKETRLQVQYDVILQYQQTIGFLELRKEVVNAYLLEMDYLGEDYYKELATATFGDVDVLFTDQPQLESD
jgi:hypothetical protein